MEIFQQIDLSLIKVSFKIIIF